MEEDKFNFLTEQFDDIKILRYQVPAFGQLPLREKIFVYYLSQLWQAGIYYGIRITGIICVSGRFWNGLSGNIPGIGIPMSSGVF
jgi:hypothetical protein